MFRSDARCASVKTIRRFFRSFSNWIDFDDARPVGHDFDFASGVALGVAEHKTIGAALRLVISESIFRQSYAQVSIFTKSHSFEGVLNNVVVSALDC